MLKEIFNRYLCKCINFILKWAVTCGFKQCSNLTCVYLEEHVQPPVKL